MPFSLLYNLFTKYMLKNNIRGVVNNMIMIISQNLNRSGKNKESYQRQNSLFWD